MIENEFETISCPICNKSDYDILFTASDYSYGNKGPFYIVRCQGCSFVYQNPRPKFEFLGKYYPKGEYFTIPYQKNNEYESIDSIQNHDRFFFSKVARSIIEIKYGYEYKSSKLYLFIGRVINLLFGKLLLNLSYFQRPNFVKNGQLLEVGFGTCSDLIQFSNDGWDVFGADVDEDCCKYANQVLGFKIVNIDVHKIDYCSNSFDVIYLSQTLEHLSYLNESLSEFRRLLKSDGQLVMKFPNINCIQARIWKSRWRGVEAPRHLSYFSKSTVTNLLKKNGFTDITVRSVNLSPFDIFCSNVPPTIQNNQLYVKKWWNKRSVGVVLQILAPFFGLGESLYVTARK